MSVRYKNEPADIYWTSSWTKLCECKTRPLLSNLRALKDGWCKRASECQGRSSRLPAPGNQGQEDCLVSSSWNSLGLGLKQEVNKT